MSLKAIGGEQASYRSAVLSAGQSRPIAPRFLPWSTRPAWGLATLPAWSAAPTILVAIVSETTVPLWLHAAITGIALGVALLLVLADHRILLESGHRSPASSWWFLLGPLGYLVSRAVAVHRATGRGWAPVLVWTGCHLVPAAYIAVALR